MWESPELTVRLVPVDLKTSHPNEDGTHSRAVEAGSIPSETALA